VKGTWPVLLPQVDRDGNEIAGVRHPYLDVPLATYTGWNPRIAATGFPGARTSFTGAYIPWSKDKILARYGNRTAYLGLFTEATLKMLSERFLSPDDLPDLLKAGVQRWENATR